MNRLTILFVADTPEVVDDLRSMLSAMTSVLWCSRLLDAFEILERLDVDLVLASATLSRIQNSSGASEVYGNIHGYKVVQFLRKNSRNTPVVILSQAVEEMGIDVAELQLIADKVGAEVFTYPNGHVDLDVAKMYEEKARKGREMHDAGRIRNRAWQFILQVIKAIFGSA